MSNVISINREWQRQNNTLLTAIKEERFHDVYQGTMTLDAAQIDELIAFARNNDIQDRTLSALLERQAAAERMAKTEELVPLPRIDL